MLGLLLRDIVFTFDGAPSHLDTDNRVANFQKYRKLVALVDKYHLSKVSERGRDEREREG